MEVVQLTLMCCRHAMVLIRHQWMTLAESETGASWRGPLRARSRLKAGR
jgi:hypothetical protein